MSTSALLLLPIDVWMAITPHLQAQDVLNLSFTCRQWYKDLADQQLWEAVYKNVLPEYPTSHFLVPDSVEKVKRRDFISLNGSEPRRLDQWSKSWKQRTVYVQHIINIQTRIVSSLRLRTNAFEPVIPKPIHDIARVHKMEAYLKSALPIDMVIFMVYFAHHVRPRPNTSLSGMTYGYSLSILSSDEFLCEKKWEDMVHEVSWLRFDVKFPLQNEKRRLYHISRGTRQFLNQLRFAPFARVSKAGNYRGSNIALSVMLSKNQDPPSDLPNTVTNQVYRLDTKHMPNAVGKVFITLTRANHRYDTHLVSESFTDYLLQYAGVVLEYGDIPIAGDMRQIDLMVRLPRPQIPKPSILLPQPPYWDICHYLPTCFPKLDVPLNPLPDRSDISQVMSSITAYERLIDMEKLPSIPIPIPTKYINSSIYKYHWNTCYGLLVLRNPLTISKRLVDCSIRNGIDIDQVSYDMLEYIAQEWITATPCKFQCFMLLIMESILTIAL
ncbi:hypothetical protein BGW37DRAFT_487893 [Umbelopsis sp. PMI_123]|nr:hypothetical protein BGW37DRAFT_487893 [Umbelopsis sp. PMI_123]